MSSADSYPLADAVTVALYVPAGSPAGLAVIDIVAGVVPELALVVNHPIYTAPGSAPIDEGDEVLWRPGRYFSSGSTDEPIAGGTITFHHRSMGELLTAASNAGWDLHRLEEFGVSGSQIEQYPAMAKQRHIPRLLGARWTRRAS